MAIPLLRRPADPVDIGDAGQRQATIAHCRDEIRHESGLMIARLNALLSGQAFLVIAYATSLGSSNGAWRQPFTLLLPPFLALVGFVLAWEGRRGLIAARHAIADWQARLDALLAIEPNDQGGTVGGRDFKLLRHEGNLFTLRAPWIFMASWTWMAALPFYLFLS